MALNMAHSPYSLSLQRIILGGRYTDLRRLGGTNSVVFSALDTCSKHKVTVKRLSTHSHVQCRAALREIRILRHLEHDNIVDMYDVLGLVDRESGELLSIYIVEEYCDTDLHCVLLSQQLDDEHVKLFSYQLIKGIKYIHSSNVIHRDIKPSNLLINLHKGELKICDFGSSRMLDPNYDHSGYLTHGKSTLWYRAPECIITPKQYNKRCDIWSAACVLAETLLGTGKALYPGKTEVEQLQLISECVCTSNSVFSHETIMIELTRDPSYSEKPIHPLSDRFPASQSGEESALDLLERMLKFNPGDRLSAEQALSHPYFDVYSYPQDEPCHQHPFQIESYVVDFTSEGTEDLKEILLEHATPIFSADDDALLKMKEDDETEEEEDKEGDEEEEDSWPGCSKSDFEKL